jgi:predicted nucleotidyltransferase
VIQEILTDYFQRQGNHGVLAAYLFGSHALGRPHRESDVDVAVVFDRSILPARSDRDEMQLRLASDLIAALKMNEVDLVVLNDAPPLLARSIVRKGVLVFCSDPHLLREFERDVQLRAADLEPFIQRGRRRLLSELRK